MWLCYMIVGKFCSICHLRVVLRNGIERIYFYWKDVGLPGMDRWKKATVAGDGKWTRWLCPSNGSSLFFSYLSEPMGTNLVRSKSKVRWVSMYKLTLYLLLSSRRWLRSRKWNATPVDIDCDSKNNNDNLFHNLHILEHRLRKNNIPGECWLSCAVLNVTK